MLSFKQAKRRHAMVAGRVTDANDALADDIYSGVTGVGVGAGSMITLAVADTQPMAYAVLLATDDIAAAFATVALLETFESSRVPRSPNEARRIASAGWKNFERLVERAQNVQHGLGGGADLDIGWQALKEVQQLKPDEAKMRRIAELAGRMYQALRGAKDKRVKGIPEEVIGTELGGDIANLLPQEYALLGTDPTKRHLFQQLSQRRALQFERAGSEKKGRGPLVIASDESGSMSGDRDEWAKASMTALTRIAWEEKRPVVVVHFSTATKVHVCKPGDVVNVLRAQHTFLNGGTEIGRALMVGVDEVKNLAAMGHKGADVVLVSDGGDAGGTIDQALEEMRVAGTRLWSIAIDMPFVGPLRDRASEYVHLSNEDMQGTEGVLKIGKAVL